MCIRDSACRAAVATLGMFRDEPVLERNRVLAARLGERLAPFTDHANVAEVRQTGMIAAVELVRDKGTRAPFPAAERRGLRAYLHGLDHGLLLRPLGDVIYFMPPYVILSLIHISEPTRLLSISYAVF